MKILKLMNSNWYMKMPVILSVPHVNFGKIACHGSNQPEDPLFVFDRVSIQRFFLESEFYQLSFIKCYGKNVLGHIPEFLDPVINKSHVLFSVGVDHHTFTHHTVIIYRYNIAGLQLT